MDLLEIEKGKFYTDRHGRKIEVVHIFKTDSNQTRYIAILNGCVVLYDGQRFSLTEKDSRIIAEWKEPIKKTMWALMVRKVNGKITTYLVADVEQKSRVHNVDGTVISIKRVEFHEGEFEICSGGGSGGSS